MNIKSFKYTNPTPVLKYTIMYRRSDNSTGFTDGVIDDKAGTEKDLFDMIMSYQTDFVKSNILRMEVTTPIYRQYGFTLFGGDAVLLATV